MLSSTAAKGVLFFELDPRRVETMATEEPWRRNARLYRETMERRRWSRVRIA